MGADAAFNTPSAQDDFGTEGARLAFRILNRLSFSGFIQASR